MLPEPANEYSFVKWKAGRLLRVNDKNAPMNAGIRAAAYEILTQRAKAQLEDGKRLAHPSSIASSRKPSILPYVDGPHRKADCLYGEDGSPHTKAHNTSSNLDGLRRNLSVTHREFKDSDTERIKKCCLQKLLKLNKDPIQGQGQGQEHGQEQKVGEQKQRRRRQMTLGNELDMLVRKHDRASERSCIRFYKDRAGKPLKPSQMLAASPTRNKGMKANFHKETKEGLRNTSLVQEHSRESLERLVNNDSTLIIPNDKHYAHNYAMRMVRVLLLESKRNLKYRSPISFE